MDQAEFKSALEAAGLFFSNSQVSTLFTAIDGSSGSGLVTVNEWTDTLAPVLVSECGSVCVVEGVSECYMGWSQGVWRVIHGPSLALKC